MLSRTAEYAIRAVLLLAQHVDRRALSTEEIATALGAPRNYLGKTLNTLVRAGVLFSARGPHGGFVLAVPADQLSVADVVELFTEQSRIVKQCILGNQPCHALNPCPAHERWVSLTEHARAPLLRTKIAELSGA